MKKIVVLKIIGLLISISLAIFIQSVFFRKIVQNISYRWVECEPITLTVVTVQEERGVVGMIEGEVTVIESVRNAQAYTEGQKIEAYVITERNIYGEERQTIEYR